MIIEDWRINYSANRPHSAHRGLSPAEFSLQWTMNRNPKPHSDWTTEWVPIAPTSANTPHPSLLL